LIELLISIAILSIVAAMVFGGYTAYNTHVSLGINGVVETKCVKGYECIIGSDGRATQMFDEMGRGIRCR
jgi:hypothetical protein